MNRGDRAEVPLVKNAGGTQVATGWQEALTQLAARLAEVQGTPVKAVASPFASNEELGALVALVDHLGGGEIVYRMPRAEDEVVLQGFPLLARRRDLAPNGRGAELLGMTRVGDDDATGGLDAVAGHDGVVIVMGDELTDQVGDFGADAALHLHLGAHPSPAAAGADFVLPLSTHAEQEGSFTNLQGRVQRFWPGIHAPGAARPAWLVVSALLAHAGAGTLANTAAEAFALLVAPHAPFAGLTFDGLGTKGALVNDTVSLPAAD
jgi:NADH-quinone oxidoreductase subunit G